MATFSHNEQCPRCKERGHDRHRDNLAVYSDGSKWCWACRYYVRPPTTVMNMKKKMYRYKTSQEKEYDLTSPNITYRLPTKALLWLSKYGITEAEVLRNNFFYDLDKELLVMPVLDGERIVNITGRYFGNNPDYPKYVTKGWKTGHFKLIPNTENDYIILVEDHISAIKVGRQFSAIPLLGAYAPKELLLSLLPLRPKLRFWLDKDKAEESRKQSSRARQWFPDCGMILTDRDPKEYSDEEIKEIITQTTS